MRTQLRPLHPRFQFGVSSLLWLMLVVAVGAFGVRERRLRAEAEEVGKRAVRCNDLLIRAMESSEAQRELERQQLEGEHWVDKYSGPPMEYSP